MKMTACGEISHRAASRWHAMACCALAMGLAGAVAYLLVGLPILTFHRASWRNHERLSLGE